jgi:hypothetical protein
MFENTDELEFDIWSGKEKDYLSELTELEKDDTFQLERLEILVKKMRQHLTNVGP